jgi:hypothetical protein
VNLWLPPFRLDVGIHPKRMMPAANVPRRTGGLAPRARAQPTLPAAATAAAAAAPAGDADMEPTVPMVDKSAVEAQLLRHRQPPLVSSSSGLPLLHNAHATGATMLLAPVAERRVIALQHAIRSKPQWWTKVWDDATVVALWRVEAARQGVDASFFDGGPRWRSCGGRQRRRARPRAARSPPPPPRRVRRRPYRLTHPLVKLQIQPARVNPARAWMTKLYSTTTTTILPWLHPRRDLLPPARQASWDDAVALQH